MFNLILKDFLIQKKMLVISIIYGGLFSFIFQSRNNPGMIFVAVSTVIAYMLLTSACAYDDKYKADVMLNSLPIKRREIVAAKYLSVIFFLIVGVAITFAVTLAEKLCGFGSINRLMGIEDIIGCAFSIILLGSLYLPIYFKFGYVKSKYVSVIFMLSAFFIPALIVEKLSQNKNSSLIELLNNQSDWVIATFLIITMLIIMTVSIMFSEKIYNYKDI